MIIVAIALAAAMAPQEGPGWAQFRSRGEAAIRAQLKDPDSAQFAWPHGYMYGKWKRLFAKSIEGYLTCGTVNARNSFGGYGGPINFVVVESDDTVIYSELGSAAQFDMLAEPCRRAASQLPPVPEPVAVPSFGFRLATDANGRVYVGDVLTGYPAAAAGLRVGMHLIKIDGIDVTGFDQPVIGTMLHDAGASVSLMVDGAADPIVINRGALASDDGQ